ncbi:arylsulfatase [Maribacter sp. 2307UL18-2]|uniref:arylsulfatase n=1 Tax=Maribacter sp. 2307UL18-2 TaxID=3386274 RepID=UPI0039BCE9C0
MKYRLIYCTFLIYLSSFSQKGVQSRQPNVILILTDDQGIGELGAHGNPWIQTPNIDKFYGNAVRLTDFHVNPVCTPTRAAIMTGRYPINNGAWATYKGRDALSQGALTMAKLFQTNGYKTGIFGKWHLGDNYPVRPTDMGFDMAVHHKAGGVGELSDYWGNTYFNDTYYVNNEPKEFKGYCTDVWFEEAMKFIENHKARPFFIYLPTNAPHSPFYVEKKYAAPYQPLKGSDILNPEFYGMITNIDENFGTLEKFLKKNKIADNTILIFMTDNGTSDGISKDGTLGYNHGFRGKKNDRTEGGHRVPFFIRWKDGDIKGGWNIDEETAHIDLLPTLANLCGISIPKERRLDGLDLSPLLLKKQTELEERTIFIHSRQDWRQPLDVENTCIIKDQWRLINGTELYHIEKDRMQLNNLAKEHPRVVDQLLKENAAFLKKAKKNDTYSEFPAAIIGNADQQEIKLTIQHAIGDDLAIWKSEQVAAGKKNQNNTHALEIEREGHYRISCRRWPKENPGRIWGVPEKNPKNWFTYKAISPEKVRIRIANQILEKKISREDEAIDFSVYLEKGKTFLVNDFIEGERTYGVYYTYLSPIEDKPANQ